MNIPHIIREEKVTVILDGETFDVQRNQSNYQKVIDAIQADDATALLQMLKPINAAKAEAAKYPEIEVTDNQVKINGEQLPEALNSRLLFMLQNHYNLKPLINFYSNLSLNCSYRAVQELFGFLEACDLPITGDGCFMAYKRVREDFTDVYTGQFDNSPGATPSMPRNQVDEDSDRTCSRGLHVCSQSYLPHFAPGGKVVMVKVNPKDVVAVPKDYNNAKMRVCAYEVIREVEVGNIPSMYIPQGDDFDNDEVDLDDPFDDLVESLKPEWANYLAMDEDGCAWFYENKPFIDETNWDCDGGYANTVHKLDDYSDDWEDSLIDLSQH